MSTDFHITFMDILKGYDKLDLVYKQIKDYVPFNFDFNYLPKCYDTVEKIAPYLLQRIKKEQQLIETNKDYYIARDIVDNTVYICFKELLVIDIDKSQHNLEYIKTHFSNKKCFSFRIYGRKMTEMSDHDHHYNYHIFCTSKKMPYRNKDTITFMIDNFCDFYYSVHSFIRGFCVRLNNKFENDNKYEYICTINKKNEDPGLVKLVKLQETLINKYSKLDVCYPKNKNIT